MESAKEKVEYHLTLTSAAEEPLCDVTISKGQVKLGETELTLTGSVNCKDDSELYKVAYKGGAGKKILQISARISDDPPSTLTCQLKEHDNTEGAADESEIDTRYLSRKSFRLSLVGTNVAVDNGTKYEVKKNEFRCEIQGSLFKAAQIACGNDTSTTVSGLQKTCSNIETEGAASCTFTIDAAENTKTLLEDVEFKIRRKDITYYNCEAGYELNKIEGKCDACDRGTYKSSDSTVSGVQSCEPCNSSELYAPNVGSSECTVCDQGHVSDDFTTCKLCLPDKVEVGGECKKCSAGTYPDKFNNECTGCEEYHFSLEGFQECISCKVGYEANVQQTGCEPCDPGQYNDEPNASKCKLCPDQKTSSYASERCTEDLDNGCEASDYYVAIDMIGRITFSNIKAGQTSRSPCHYNPASYATILCNDDGRWDEPDFSQCDSEKTKEFEEIKPYAKIDEVVEKTQTEIAPKDVEILAKKMSNETELKNKFESETALSIRDLASKTLIVMSNLMVAAKTSPTDQAVKNNVVNTAETILSVALSNLRDNDDILILKTDMMEVFLLREASSAPVMSVGDSLISVDVSSDSNIGRLAASIYKNNSMFRVPESYSVSGHVVGLRHLKKDDSKTQDVKFKINFTRHAVSEDEDSTKRVSRECKYYETRTDSWSTVGCRTTVDQNNNIVCDCDHMTSFAVIMSVSENMTVGWLSDLVLGINIVFCLLTLLCTLPFRTFRVRKMTIIQSHSIFCLILLCTCWYLMHLDFGSLAYLNTQCKVVAFIAHYFLMATFSWICCCTLTLKSQIVDAVKSFGKKKKNLVKKCVLFAYGFPLLIPTLALILNYLIQETYKSSSLDLEKLHYIRKSECWYEDLWVYCFILFPIYVFMLINFVCFFKIMRVVGNARKASDGSSERRVVKAGFALAFTQGLPWIIHPGVIAGQSAAMVFQYLFLITFGLQGIGLFMFNVLFQEEVLKNLCGMLNVKPPDIFLSVVPKQRHTPHTGETSMATSRNCSSQENKCYSTNITLNSVTAVGDKSIYQDSTYYNELHENSIVTEHRYETHVSPTQDINTRSEGSRTELFEKKAPDIKVRFVGHNRVYSAECKSDREVQRSPIPGEIENAEHQCPPLM